MNKDRRKRIERARTLLEEVKEKFEEAKALIEECADEERDYYDNMPENMQSGERGEQADAAANGLEEAKDALEELDLDDLLSKLEEAAT